MADSPQVTPDAPPVVPATPPVAPATPPPNKPTLFDGEPPKDGDAKAEPPKDGDAKAEPPKDGDPAPVTYEAFTVPEGFTLEGDRLESFTKWAGELKLDQAAAQKAIDYYTSLQADNQKLAQEHEAQLVSTWRQEVSALPESKQLIQDARTAASRFATTPGSRELLSGWVGEHPEVLQLLARVGAHFRTGNVTQDKPGAAVNTERGTAEDLYPSMKPKTR